MLWSVLRAYRLFPWHAWRVAARDGSSKLKVRTRAFASGNVFKKNLRCPVTTEGAGTFQLLTNSYVIGRVVAKIHWVGPKLRNLAGVEVKCAAEMEGVVTLG